MTRLQTDSSTTQAQYPQVRIPHASAGAGAGRGGNNYQPPMLIAFPGDNDPYEAARLRDHVTALLDEIDMPRTGATLFEEECDGEVTKEPGNSLPPYHDPVIAEECGILYIAPWGGLYQKPHVLWMQQGIGSIEGGQSNA